MGFDRRNRLAKVGTAAAIVLDMTPPRPGHPAVRRRPKSSAFRGCTEVADVGAATMMELPRPQTTDSAGSFLPHRPVSGPDWRDVKFSDKTGVKPPYRDRTVSKSDTTVRLCWFTPWRPGFGPWLQRDRPLRPADGPWKCARRLDIPGHEVVIRRRAFMRCAFAPMGRHYRSRRHLACGRANNSPGRR